MMGPILIILGSIFSGVSIHIVLRPVILFVSLPEGVLMYSVLNLDVNFTPLLERQDSIAISSNEGGIFPIVNDYDY